MAGGSTDFTIAEDGSYTAPLTLFYPYARTVGPTMARFLTGLREQRIEGNVTADGRVNVPPIEFDPSTGATPAEWRPVGPEGTVTTWAWQPVVLDGQTLTTPHALAMVLLDGADVAMMHVVDAQSPAAMSTGMRVTARWADEPTAAITDVVFVPTGHEPTGHVPTGHGGQ